MLLVIVMMSLLLKVVLFLTDKGTIFIVSTEHIQKMHVGSLNNGLACSWFTQDITVTCELMFFR